MASGAPARRSSLRVTLAVMAVALVIAGILLRAPTPDAPRADIVIERAALRDTADGWLLDAQAQVQLPLAVRLGLDSGVPLDFVIELSVTRPRTLLPDRELHAARWSYRLVYYDLTRHYRLGMRQGDDARNYRSLSNALEGLGELRGLGIATEADAGEASRNGLQATLRMRLDSRALPLPLQPLIGTAWRVRAVPFTWTLAA